MPAAFSLLSPLEPTPKPRRVLVTGAAGRIGSYFAQNAPEVFSLRLMVRPGEDASHLAGRGEIVEADLGDLDRLKEVFAGMDTILHLAGNPDPTAVWTDLHRDNIVGTYHAMAAAKASGCRRLVYASSIHAVGGYPRDVQVHESDPVNPGDLYGVTKAFGEALGRYMAEQEGLSVVSVRIAGFQPAASAGDEGMAHLLDAFVSDRDLLQLFVRIIEDERVRYAVVHGNSDNTFKRLSIDLARSLFGYSPQDDAMGANPVTHDLVPGLLAHSLADGQASGIREEASAVEGRG